MTTTLDAPTILRAVLIGIGVWLFAYVVNVRNCAPAAAESIVAKKPAAAKKKPTRAKSPAKKRAPKSPAKKPSRAKSPARVPKSPAKKVNKGAAYLAFCYLRRDEVVEERPSFTESMIGSELSRRWHKLTDSERAEYEEDA